MTATRRIWSALAWTLWGLLPAGLLAITWMDGRLRRVGRPDLISLDADAVPYLLAMASAGTVGRSWPAAGPAIRSAGCCSPWPRR
jgi:hypothetical protein